MEAYYQTALEYLTNFSSRILSVIATIQITDIIDMALMAYIIYKGIKIIRETKAQQLIVGIFIMLVVYGVSAALKLKVMTFMFGNFFQVGLIAIVVVFQPELRRVLERVGRANVFSSGGGDISEEWEKTINIIGEASRQLSETRTGALIVIERTNKLGEQVESGTVLNCLTSISAIGAIFYKGNPLHDGAVIIRDAKIYAAGCFLPTPQKEERIDKQLGSRHRAAIGMSENSDAIVVVVSEETGGISVAENGNLVRRYMLKLPIEEEAAQKRKQEDIYGKDGLIEFLKDEIIGEGSREVNITGILKIGKELINGKKKDEK